MEKSSFFNSVAGDRKYDASSFAAYFNSFITNGVFPNPSTNLQVIANNDMTITISIGKGWINGYFYLNDAVLILPIEVADGILKRIDRIVLQFNTVGRSITAKVKKGTFASSPVAPTLQRDADAYELALGDVYVGAGVVSVVGANITDQRINTALCGWVNSLIQVDTTAIFDQYQAWYAAKQTAYNVDFTDWYANTTGTAESDVAAFEAQFQSDFTIWFDAMKDQLTVDAAGNLQAQITSLSGAGWTTETVKQNADDVVILQAEVGELDTAQAAHLADYMPHDDETNSYASSIDVNGIYTVVDFKRVDATLYLKSTLSNTDASGNYQTVTWQFYATDGTTLSLTKTWTLTYNIDNLIITKVVA